MIKYECKFLMPFTSKLFVCLFRFQPCCRDLCEFRNKKYCSILPIFPAAVVFSTRLYPIIEPPPPPPLGFIPVSLIMHTILYASSIRTLSVLIVPIFIFSGRKQMIYSMIAVWKMDVKMKLICRIKIMEIWWNKSQSIICSLWVSSRWPPHVII